jgi:hypothetical protein
MSRAAVEKGRLLRKRDWLGDAAGLIQVTALSMVCCLGVAASFQESTRSANLIPLLCLLAAGMPLYAIYCLSQENNLTMVETNLTASENHQLVIFALSALDWDVRTNSRSEVTAGARNKWWRGAGQTATTLIVDDKIYLNVSHGSTYKGRLPFYFGSNRRKLNRLIATIESGKAILAYKI